MLFVCCHHTIIILIFTHLRIIKNSYPRAAHCGARLTFLFLSRQQPLLWRGGPLF